MALNLRKSIARNGVMVGGFCLLASLVLSAFTDGKLEASMASLGWPTLLAPGIGGVTAWQVRSRIKQGILRSLPPALSYLQLQRGQPVNGIEIGVAFHALVLYSLWKGIAATRQSRRPARTPNGRDRTVANG